MHTLMKTGLFVVLAMWPLTEAVSQDTSGTESVLNSGRHRQNRSFRRIATFPVINNYCAAAAPNSCFDKVAIAEIVAASEHGDLLIYTDSVNKSVGFVDIKNPSNPVPGGTLSVGGEPTSVGVVGTYALVAVNTSPSYTSPSGHLTVIDLRTKTIVPGAAAINLGGQPDSIAISPNRQYAAIAIENERDEDFNDGELPQLPGGKLVRVRLSPWTHPLSWTFQDINLSRLATLYPNAPRWSSSTSTIKTLRL